MLEQTTRIVSENLARAVDRRTFLKRSSQAAFAGLIALAVGGAFPGKAAAAGTQPPTPTPNCAPPGPYCNNGGGILTGCHGAHCFDHLVSGTLYQCWVYYQYYQGGCWTASGSGGYWTCCDCACGNPQVATCGCAQFSGTPSPVPASPKG